LTVAGQIPVSVLILTLNEAGNIQRCMDSVRWSDDIVVLDSFSIDDTVEQAQSAGARSYQRTFDDFARQRNYALDHIAFTHEWILHLDADEVVTAELRDEIAMAIADARFCAYRLASKLMFLGRWLRFSGMYPSYQVRLGRKGALRFEQVGHGQRESPGTGRIGTLENACLHFGFSKGLADWIERHNRYSTAEAMHEMQWLGRECVPLPDVFALSDRMRRRRALKILAARLPFRPVLRFVYMYVARLGFLDGYPGLVYCRLLSMYEYWIVLKVRELQKNPSSTR
jgi:glycosyltransferase involved in cell wall biosynthesis